MLSSGKQGESFDSGVKYFAGNFIGSDVSRDGFNGDIGMLSEKAIKSATVPRPFHLTTMDRHGDRGYSTNSRRIEDRKAYIEERKKALRRAHNINFKGKSGQRARKATTPQLPRLMTKEKKSDRNYSTNSKRVKSTHGSSSSVPRRKGRHVTVPKPPRLVTMEKNGTRSYSTFSGNRSHSEYSVGSGASQLSLSGSRSYDHQSFDSKPSRKSHRKTTTPRPFRLRTTEKNGERLYSFSSTPWMQQNRKSSNSWNGRSVTVPVPFRLSSSPFKHAPKENISTPRYTFKALPLPNFDYQPFERRHTNNRIGTIPKPFDLSTMTDRPRSQSLPRRHRFKALPLPKFNASSSKRNGIGKRLATVPQPFDLSTMTKRPRSQSLPRRRRFKALPHPNFNNSSSERNGAGKKLATVPQPFGSSAMARRARSHSPLHRQRKENSNGASVRMSRFDTYNASRGFSYTHKPKNPRGKRKVLPAKPPLKRRRSLKSKHRFSEKHQGKEFTIRGMNNSKSEHLERSVNPNLNAGREARRRYMDQVSLEVALLKEEWRLYKEEAERALQEIEQAKREKAKKRKKLGLLTEKRTVDKSDRERARLIKHISNLEKFIEYKSDIHAEFTQKMEENERRRRRISLRFKDNFIKSESEARPTALTVRGKHRNIRRSSSVRIRETGTLLNLFTDDENENSLGDESFSETDDELQNHGHQQSLFDSQYEERENSLATSSDTQPPYCSEALTFDLIGSREKSEEDSHDELKQRKEQESRSLSHGDESEDAIPIPDSQSEQLAEDVNDHETESRNVSSEENSEYAVTIPDTDSEQHLGEDVNDHQTESRNISSEDAVTIPDTDSEQHLGEDVNDHQTESRNISNGENSEDAVTIPDTESEDLDLDENQLDLRSIPMEENGDHAVTIPDTSEQLGEDLDDHRIESRNVSDEASSQRLEYAMNQNVYDASEDTSNKEPTNTRKQFRRKGNFGDDFEASALTNLFRGGWHRGLTQEHLSQSSTLRL